jgi:hypothetical protein
MARLPLSHSTRLALALAESNSFLASPDFLEAPTAEEGVQRHIEFDAEVADRYGLDPDEIWRAFAARDIGRILKNLSPDFAAGIAQAVIGQ